MHDQHPFFSKEPTMNPEGTQPTAKAQTPKKSSATVGDNAIREFRVKISEEALVDLR